jgi:hypothetical protein
MWCFDHSIETITAVAGGSSHELDLCARHLHEVLSGARAV